MNKKLLTPTEAVAVLVREGHDPDDAVAVIESLIAAGLNAPQPPNGDLLDSEDLAVAREQLTETDQTQI